MLFGKCWCLFRVKMELFMFSSLFFFSFIHLEIQGYANQFKLLNFWELVQKVTYYVYIQAHNAYYTPKCM